MASFSKSQLCLHKILHIISSCQAREISTHQSLINSEPKRFDFDLNLISSGPSPETDESGSPAVEKSSESECEEVKDLSGGGGGGDSSLAVEEKRTELPEIEVASLQATSFDSDKSNGGGFEEDRDGDVGGIKTRSFSSVEHAAPASRDCLWLLIEAAKVVSAGAFDDAEPSPLPPNGSGSGKRSSGSGKRNKYWMVDLYDGEFEEVSPPVVRSKRGRSQVLPSRYRDSVLEPWNRLSRSASVKRHRPNSTTVRHH